MSSARLLPGEQRRPTYKPSVEEAKTSSSSTARSVRSIRQRFEAQVMTPSPAPSVTTPKTTSGALDVASPAATNALSKTTSPSSAPSTPAKKRSTKLTARPQHQQQTKTQAQLAAFLRERASSNSQHSTGEPNQRESVTVDVSPSNVGSLIEKWSSASSVPRQYYADRNPLQERHLQRPHDHHQPPHPQPFQTATGSTVVDSVDTFGSSSVDFDQIIPKTDPGRLESYAAHARMLATKQQQHQLGGQHPAIQHPATGDQSLKEMMTRGIVPQPQHQPHHNSQNSEHPQVGNDNSSSRIPLQAEPRHHNLRSEPNPAPNSSNIQNRIEQFMQMTQTEVVVQVKQTHTTIRSESNLRNESNLDITELTDPSPPPSHRSQHPEFELSSISPASDETTVAEAVLEGEVDDHPETTHQHRQPTGSTQSHPASDWGAGDVYIRELFSEAEETAERAVQCDENEEYFEAFELYWVVVDLYSKVIPFLSQAEGVDVHERIKMYTRRCQAIREAFEDDDVEDGEEDTRGNNEDANKLQNAASIDASNGHNNVGNSDNADLVHTFSNVRITGADTVPRNPAEAVGRLQSNDPSSEEKKNTRPLAMDQMGQTSDQAPQHVKQSQNERQKIIPETVEQGEPSANGELRRTPYPDFAERPMANIPDASEQARPRPPFLVTGTGPSAATQAHRSSLSRPISRSAARASTNSVSKEKVAEMQERVNLMQECLNNFTVKQKHLGPARALELAVTTLNANTFGDLKKLEPLAPELEHKWATELGVLLSMLKEIKVVRPGIGYALREDIAKHLPALERCDRSVRKTMRSFGALSGHVRYVERETASSGSAKGGRGRRRWWVKVPVVDHGGLNSDVLKIVEEAEQEMRSVFKICHEINVEVVKTIPVPISFVEGLPKHARSLIHKELKEGLTTWGMFKVSDYMKDRKMWDKESAKEITSSLEKVALIWEARTSNKSFLSRTFDIRGERFHQAMTAFRRCQNAIRDLRREWPTMQHTDLDMAKIQHNEDIGLAGLESYSRALESRAYRLLTRIRELLEANAQAKEEGNTS